MGGTAIGNKNLGVPAFIKPFIDGDLSSGILTITHNLGNQYVSVTVINNNDRIILPDQATLTSLTQCTIDLTSYGILTGTWRVVVIDSGATNNTIPTATNLNLSSQAENDFAILEGSDWVAKGGTEKIKVDSFSRDISLASGNQAISGIGFRPSYITLIASAGGTDKSSIGFSDGLRNRVHVQGVNGTTGEFEVSTSLAIRLYDGGSGNRYEGNITFDSDGFTIAWTKTGTTTGTAVIAFTAFR